MIAETTNAIPWDILGNVGAAGIAVLMCIIFLREIQRRDVANSRDRTDDRREFLTSLKEISDSLGKRIDRVHERLDEIHGARHGDRK